MKQYSSKDEILKELVQERNIQVKELKQDMTQVCDLFTRTAKLMENSKPMVDVIEANIDSIDDETENGVQLLAKVYS